MIMLLTMCIISCGCIVRPKIICADISRAAFKPMVFCDISFSPEPRCRCRCFDMNVNRTINDSSCDKEDTIFKSGNYPIEHCDEIGGPTKKDWAIQVKPNIQRLQSIKKTYCK